MHFDQLHDFRLGSGMIETLKHEKFSDGKDSEVDFVDIVKLCLEISRSILTLDDNDLVVIIIALEQEMVIIWINFQVAAWMQSMELMFEVLIVNYVSGHVLRA